MIVQKAVIDELRGIIEKAGGEYNRWISDPVGKEIFRIAREAGRPSPLGNNALAHAQQITDVGAVLYSQLEGYDTALRIIFQADGLLQAAAALGDVSETYGTNEGE